MTFLFCGKELTEHYTVLTRKAFYHKKGLLCGISWCRWNQEILWGFWKSLVSHFWPKMNLKTSQHCCFIQMDSLQLISRSTFIQKTGIQKVEIRKSKFWILNWGLLFCIFFQDSTLLQFSCFLVSLSIFSSFPETGWVIMRSAWIAVVLQPTKCLDLCGTV